MSESLHDCAVPGCGRQISLAFLMCPAHWAMVPRALQQRVYSAWRVWQKDFRSTAAARAHRAAKDAAVEAVQKGGIA